MSTPVSRRGTATRSPRSARKISSGASPESGAARRASPARARSKRDSPRGAAAASSSKDAGGKENRSGGGGGKDRPSSSRGAAAAGTSSGKDAKDAKDAKGKESARGSAGKGAVTFGAPIESQPVTSNTPRGCFLLCEVVESGIAGGGDVRVAEKCFSGSSASSEHRDVRSAMDKGDFDAGVKAAKAAGPVAASDLAAAWFYELPTACVEFKAVRGSDWARVAKDKDAIKVLVKKMPEPNYRALRTIIRAGREVVASLGGRGRDRDDVAKKIAGAVFGSRGKPYRAGEPEIGVVRTMLEEGEFLFKLKPPQAKPASKPSASSASSRRDNDRDRDRDRDRDSKERDSKERDSKERDSRERDSRERSSRDRDADPSGRDSSRGRGRDRDADRASSVEPADRSLERSSSRGRAVDRAAGVGRTPERSSSRDREARPARTPGGGPFAAPKLSAKETLAGYPSLSPGVRDTLLAAHSRGEDSLLAAAADAHIRLADAEAELRQLRRERDDRARAPAERSEWEASGWPAERRALRKRLEEARLAAARDRAAWLSEKERMIREWIGHVDAMVPGDAEVDFPARDDAVSDRGAEAHRDAGRSSSRGRGTDRDRGSRGSRGRDSSRDRDRDRESSRARDSKDKDKETADEYVSRRGSERDSRSSRQREHESSRSSRR